MQNNCFQRWSPPQPFFGRSETCTWYKSTVPGTWQWRKGIGTHKTQTHALKHWSICGRKRGRQKICCGLATLPRKKSFQNGGFKRISSNDRLTPMHLHLASGTISCSRGTALLLLLSALLPLQTPGSYANTDWKIWPRKYEKSKHQDYSKLVWFSKCIHQVYFLPVMYIHALLYCLHQGQIWRDPKHPG